MQRVVCLQGLFQKKLIEIQFSKKAYVLIWNHGCEKMRQLPSRWKKGSLSLEAFCRPTPQLRVLHSFASVTPNSKFTAWWSGRVWLAQQLRNSGWDGQSSTWLTYFLDLLSFILQSIFTVRYSLTIMSVFLDKISISYNHIIWTLSKRLETLS